MIKCSLELTPTQVFLARSRDKLKNDDILKKGQPTHILIPQNDISSGNSSVDSGQEAMESLRSPKRKTPQKPLRQMLDENCDLFHAFTDEDLLMHPNYVRLPLPEAVDKIECFSDVSKFREGSVQWDILHIGRISSSKVSGTLGIYEPETARKLGIPFSMGGSEKAQIAFQRLQEDVIFSNVEEANKILISSNQEEEKKSFEQIQREILADFHKTHNFATLRRDEEATKVILRRGQTVIWTNDGESEYVSSCETAFTKIPDYVSSRFNYMQNVGDVKMRWGTVHEATGIILAMNFFKTSRVHQCGLFPSEALLEEELSSDDPLKLDQQRILREMRSVGLNLGATPDGVIVHKDGSFETLEVKNHCPFKMFRGHSFVEHSNDLNEVPIWYLPQIQLEMFCKGFNCKSSILVRLSSVSGAIYRVKRDDEYIMMMLSRCLKFHQQFVQSGVPPPRNFWKDSFLTKKIIMRLKKMRSRCVLLRDFETEEIQRHPHYSIKV